MDAANFRKEIRASWNALEPLGLQKTLIQLSSLTADDEFRNVAFDPSASYADVYRTGLSRSQYNYILHDYSYFQFSQFSEDSWRLAYLPNPWLTGIPQAQKMQEEWEALEEIGGLSHEDASSLLSEMNYAGVVPPIRFEIAPLDYNEFSHPAAHFHIGHFSENRWPSAISPGPLAFLLLVTKLYYPQRWNRLSSYAGGPANGCFEEKLLKALVDTRLVTHSLFSEKERRSFHFGRGMYAVGPSLVGKALDRFRSTRRARD